MGLYIQFQRRAIESFAGEPEVTGPPDIIDLERIRNIDGNSLYYAGVSEGLGTCSDILGMNVLVLKSKPTGASREVGELACAYAVLLREPTPTESASDHLARVGISRLCVELLNPILDHQNEGVAIFEPTGKNILYTAVV